METFKVVLPYGTSSNQNIKDAGIFIASMVAFSKIYKTSDVFDDTIQLCRSQKSFIKFDIESVDKITGGKQVTMYMLTALFGSSEDAIMVKLSL